MTFNKQIKFFPLIEAILDGDVSRSIKEVNILVKKQVKPEEIISESFKEVVKELDKKCTIEYFNLLEIMLAGRAIMAVVKNLYPDGIPRSEARLTVAIASVKGDVHDLGKNIVVIMLTASGYHVIDCGKDCPIEELINAAEREDASAILVSGLISTIISQVQNIKKILKKRGLNHIKIIAGGGALKQSTAEFLNVDFVAENIFDGIQYLNENIRVELS